ncbi:hypothetical protein EGR_10593 [Echinococcus granulosus]|uniref:Uncharacterized protein n=1 Tax=Echinococcus granulosus TaxID=6210 RepID=W6U200_ECHGR|nr:hypothetical protein EGR_10593 [Echinococcus granulosus]EUB54551.1 hypothetical protein EGR_10593 [Echinococcus granulosus]
MASCEDVDESRRLRMQLSKFGSEEVEAVNPDHLRLSLH